MKPKTLFTQTKLTTNNSQEVKDQPTTKESNQTKRSVRAQALVSIRMSPSNRQCSTRDTRWIWNNPPLTGHRRPQVVAPVTLQDKSTKKEPDTGDAIGPRERSRDAVYYTYVPCIPYNAARGDMLAAAPHLSSQPNADRDVQKVDVVLLWFLFFFLVDFERRTSRRRAPATQNQRSRYETRPCSSWLWLWLFFVIVIIMIILCMCVMCWRFFCRSMPYGYFLHLLPILFLGLLQVISYWLLAVGFCQCAFPPASWLAFLKWLHDKNR